MLMLAAEQHSWRWLAGWVLRCTAPAIHVRMKKLAVTKPLLIATPALSHSPRPGAAVKRLTPARLAAGILAGLNGLDGYTRAAEALAFEMAQEDGVAEAGAVLESCLLG